VTARASVDDTITAEIVRNALAVAAEEASVVVVRSSHSTWIQEGADAAAALLTSDGRLVAQSAATTLLHAASLRCSLRSLLDDIPAADMVPGDVYALNDPYRGGIHANDILVFRPVFAEGQAGAAYVAGTVIHVADVGGANPGGLASLATDTFAEGVLLPPIRLHRAGEPQADVFAILRRNSRLPDKTVGDVQALIAGTTTLARRVGELLDRYGAATLAAHVDALLDHSAHQVREGLRRLPEGTTRGRFTIDTDGVDAGRTFEVVVEATVADGAVRLDFSGTSPQAQGPINASYSQALSGVVYAVRCFVDPTIPMNEGSFRPVEVHFPPGSLLDPDPPAACGGRVVSVTAAVDAVLAALGDEASGTGVAASSLIQVFTLSGARLEGDPWVLMSYEYGGIGARPGSDGPDATGCYFFGGRSVIPQVEPVEAQHPVLVDAVRLTPDSGGPGRWRGGLGVEMRVRLLEPAQLTVRGDRMVLPPPGAGGGQPGRAGGFAVERAAGSGTEALAPRQSHVPLAAGDVFVLRSSGGGGLGPVAGRSAADVVHDVREGRVSRRAASDDYGVLVDPTIGAPT
jgi:N-methylhydantoinase B